MRSLHPSHACKPFFSPSFHLFSFPSSPSNGDAECLLFDKGAIYLMIVLCLFSNAYALSLNGSYKINEEMENGFSVCRAGLRFPCVSRTRQAIDVKENKSGNSRWTRITNGIVSVVVGIKLCTNEASVLRFSFSLSRRWSHSTWNFLRSFARLPANK